MRSFTAVLLLTWGVLACGKISADSPDDGAPSDGAPAGGAASDGASTGGASTDDAPVVHGGACNLVGVTVAADDGCNSCLCSETGWVCGEMACPPGPTGCTPGSIYDDANCKVCTCTDEGVFVCEEGCGRFCEQGTVKSAGDGCNTCACGEDGQWVCTEAACPEPACPTPDESCGELDGYFGRAEHTDACCKLCDYPLGYHYYETLEACEASKACESGEMKYADDQCNTCTCTVDGTWACTATDCEPTYCGGFAGNTCREDEYCAYEAGLGSCGAGDASAICRPRPSQCTDEEAPVCACNGEPFANACLANLAGYGISSSGECAMP